MSTKKNETPTEKAGREHLNALEALARAERPNDKRRALDHAVSTFEAFIISLPKREESGK